MQFIFHKSWFIWLKVGNELCIHVLLFPREKVRKPSLTFRVCILTFLMRFAHSVCYITAAIHILCVLKSFRGVARKGRSTRRETMAYLWWLPPCLITEMICDIFWEGHILLLSRILRFRPHETQDTQTQHMREALEEANCLIWSFPDSSFFFSFFFLEQGRTLFSLPHRSVWATQSGSLPFTHTPGLLLNYPGMPHMSLYSYNWLQPSWLQSLLSTQLKTNSSWPGETAGRHLFL